VLLRCIVGLLPFDQGEVHYRENSLANRAALQRLRSASSYVFQHNALFDSITVFENVLLPLRARGNGCLKEWRAKAQSILERMELHEDAKKFPEELSGGMQKRLAVARALVTEPEVVFFDEPTAGLDPIRRNTVFEMIARLQAERQFTAVLVTHDVAEALVVSSQILWLEAGSVRFDGSPEAFGESKDELLCKFRDNLEALRASLR
jgi:phospholipid/cholesterol/gamma-HCH transport system ATP-binding protein